MKPATKRQPLSRTTIAQLNQIARRFERAGVSAGDAVNAAAAAMGLTPHTAFESGNLYRSERGKFVMGWTNGARVEHGGSGFDDQID